MDASPHPQLVSPNHLHLTLTRLTVTSNHLYIMQLNARAILAFVATSLVVSSVVANPIDIRELDENTLVVARSSMAWCQSDHDCTVRGERCVFRDPRRNIGGTCQKRDGR